MTQHDYSIANQGAAAFRTDLNNALSATLTNNSGASAPSTTAAYMEWADSTNKLSKRRNSGDSAWLIKGNLDSDMVVTKTTSYTVVEADYEKLILGDATSAAFTISLTAAATLGEGFEVTIKKSDSSANAVTIDPNSTETIDGATTLALNERYQAVTLYCDGSNWHVKAFDTIASTQAQQEAGTSTSSFVTPARQHFHPSSAKAWGYITRSGTTYTLQTSYNITSITRNSIGNVTVTIANDISSANYAVLVSGTEVGNFIFLPNTIAAGSFVVEIRNSTSGANVDAGFSFLVFGDL